MCSFLGFGGVLVCLCINIQKIRRHLVKYYVASEVLKVIFFFYCAPKVFILCAHVFYLNYKVPNRLRCHQILTVIWRELS